MSQAMQQRQKNTAHQNRTNLPPEQKFSEEMHPMWIGRIEKISKTLGFSWFSNLFWSNFSFYEFQDILRYNDFMNDKYGERDPWNAICSRGDLVEDGTASPNGCYDTKATHFAGLSKNKSFFNLKRFKNASEDNM